MRLHAVLLTLVLAGCASACATASATPDLRRHLEHWQAPAQGPVKVAFFDADDTLRETKDGKVSLLPNRAAALKDLVMQGYLVAIASNQGGIAAGHVSLGEVDQSFADTVALIRAGGGDVHWVDFADAHDDNRKPNAGMARALEKYLVKKLGPSFTIDKAASFMVGDDLKGADSGFAKSFGIRFYNAWDFFPAGDGGDAPDIDADED